MVIGQSGEVVGIGIGFGVRIIDFVYFGCFENYFCINFGGLQGGSGVGGEKRII